MSSIEDEHEIQALLPGRKNPAFRESICIRGPDRGGDNVEAFGLENSIKSLAEGAIIVMDQETQGPFSLGKLPNQLPGLLSDPDLIGVGDDTGEMNLARAQLDEKEHVNGLQPDGFHSEKITSQNLIFVVGYELAPTDRSVANRSRKNAVTVENVANGGLGNLDTQFDDCAPDFAVTPAGVLLSETENKAFGFRAGGWPPARPCYC